MKFTDYSFSILFLIIAIVLVIVAFICIIANSRYRYKNDYSNGLLSFATLVLTVFAIIAVCLVPSAVSGDISKYNKTAYQTALESNYTVFIDGSPVDGTKLNIDHYKASFNDEFKEVYLTPKN